MRNTEVAAKRGRIHISSGNPIHTIYSPQMLEDGQIDLIPIGTENTDELIKSHYEETTLECILARFANGDLTALNRYQPVYADLSNAPKTLAEALQTVINSRAAFDALPVDVKKEFDSDFNKWLASAGTPEWMNAMESILPKQAPATDPAQPEKETPPDSP